MTVELLDKAGTLPRDDEPAQVGADLASLPRLAPDGAAPERETAEKPQDETPRKTWGLARLSRRLEREDEGITNGEIAAAPHYWYLGTILALARPSLPHGQVMRWRQAHGIKPSRAYRGRLLAATQGAEQDFTGDRGRSRASPRSSRPFGLGRAMRASAALPAPRLPVPAEPTRPQNLTPKTQAPSRPKPLTPNLATDF